jgi:hypothetical protein
VDRPPPPVGDPPRRLRRWHATEPSGCHSRAEAAFLPLPIEQGRSARNCGVPRDPSGWARQSLRARGACRADRLADRHQPEGRPSFGRNVWRSLRRGTASVRHARRRSARRSGSAASPARRQRCGPSGRRVRLASRPHGGPRLEPLVELLEKITAARRARLCRSPPAFAVQRERDNSCASLRLQEGSPSHEASAQVFKTCSR